MNIPTEPTRGSHKASLVRSSLAALAFVGLGALLWQLPAHSEEAPRLVPAAVVDESAAADAATRKAVFAGGCFWGVQGVFQHVKGVKQAVSGYAGGSKASADYHAVSSGTTGHAESVEITYDPKQISYGQLLQIFFSVVHDPTQLNRQGADRGTQYRSEVFAVDDAQKRIADAYIAQLNKAAVFSQPIVTRVEVTQKFYPAEDYHQDFLTLNPRHPYIAALDIPKVENLQKLFPQRYREKPVLVMAGR